MPVDLLPLAKFADVRQFLVQHQCGAKENNPYIQTTAIDALS